MVNILKNNKIAILIGIFVAVAIILSGSNRAHAQGTNNNQPQNTSEQSQQNNSGDVYKYVAQPGDSYSLIARKAVQTYGAINKVNLSEAQIIFIETNLTQLAGSPSLTTGQSVEINSNTIKQWADKATQLTQQQLAAWNVYAQNADFNTNNVGQAKS